jgi:uncharacterized protein (DUF2062 family)
VPDPIANASAPSRNLWQRLVRDPILAQLTQGVTPDKIASTLAIGAACSLFPLFGFTTVLNLGAGIWLRLNQPILQTLNQLLGPVQFVLIIPSIRVGEWIWRADEGSITLTEVLRVFREASPAEFLQRFGWAGIHAVTTWLLAAPVLVAVLYLLLRPVLRKLASVRLRRA